MTDKKKNKKVLVKVSDLTYVELDAALDAALDELLGPDKEKEEDQSAKKITTKQAKSGKSRKKK